MPQMKNQKIKRLNSFLTLRWRKGLVLLEECSIPNSQEVESTDKTGTLSPRETPWHHICRLQDAHAQKDSQ